MSYNVAVVGATGNVGMAIVHLLESRKFPVNELFLLASEKSVGTALGFRGKEVRVENLDKFDFSQVDIVLSSAGAEISAKFAPQAAKGGAVIIDNTSHFRFFDDVPLVVPEVNEEKIEGYQTRGIIANPNCNVIPISVVLKPLHKRNPLKRLIVSTYQSVSGAGKEAMDELFEQTKSKFVNQALPAKVFPHPIAFNVIPQVGEITSNGYTEEEIKTERELHKILETNIPISATCARVPTFIGHSASIIAEFQNNITASEARQILRAAKGVLVIDDRKEQRYITPIDTVGEEAVFVSRIRNCNSAKNCLNLWISSDNLRKGAALNAIQIAEKLIDNYL